MSYNTHRATYRGMTVTLVMPELTHYGYDGGTGYAKANRTYERELMRAAKKEFNLTGVRGTTERCGGQIIFSPHWTINELVIEAAE